MENANTHQIKPTETNAPINPLENAINLVSESSVGKSYECNFCKDGTPHLMAVLSKNGDIHVHAPFSNKYLMNQFVEAIITEQNKYNLKNGSPQLNR